MKVLEYIQSESDRQSAGPEETINMVGAWKYVFSFRAQQIPNLDTVKHISFLITGNETYRTTPAVFNQGVPAINAQLISTSMLRWKEMVAIYGKLPIDDAYLDTCMKEFLDIHPFADGNGRVASLLYNFFRGTIMDPVPLPYYFDNN